jgi:hypothetical protein
LSQDNGPAPSTTLSLLSSRAKPRDLQFSSSASAADESETADPSASLGMTKERATTHKGLLLNRGTILKGGQPERVSGIRICTRISYLLSITYLKNNRLCKLLILNSEKSISDTLLNCAIFRIRTDRGRSNTVTRYPFTVKSHFLQQVCCRITPEFHDLGDGFRQSLQSSRIPARIRFGKYLPTYRY